MVHPWDSGTSFIRHFENATGERLPLDQFFIIRCPAAGVLILQMHLSYWFQKSDRHSESQR